ncbi:MAG: ATP-binding protein [Bacteroidales bacterium]|nr:ATP-binding protein [Bacteroidales bacterium]
MRYYQRHIDEQLIEWKNAPRRMPLLVRGARQVGKTTAVRELGKTFKYYLEINLERQQSLRNLFTDDVDVKKTCANLSATLSVPIVPGETLLFIDEIQSCQAAIRSLRYFKEDYPELHVIAAGSLLEFALEELPSFAVGRIRSLYMYPFSFDEFLLAQGHGIQVDAKNAASPDVPLVSPLHIRLIEQLRSFLLVGGMPTAVVEWIESNDFASVRRIHNDILDTYQDDFSKYNKRVSPVLLRMVLRSVALQAGKKFVYAQVSRDTHSASIKEALSMLALAGLATPVTHTAGNGLPLGAEENISYRKFLFLDTGLLLTMLGIPAADILLSDTAHLVNKGPLSEMFAGLELIKYGDCFVKPSLHYWQHQSKNGNAEVDYLMARNGKVLPIEVKANTQGGMQSLYFFMRMRHLSNAIRTSLENFSKFDHIDTQDNNSVRHIEIIPMYALRTCF